MLASYADLHHCILSDACHSILSIEISIFFSTEGYPTTLLQACTLKTLKSVPSEPQQPPSFI